MHLCAPQKSIRSSVVLKQVLFFDECPEHLLLSELLLHNLPLLAHFSLPILNLINQHDQILLDLLLLFLLLLQRLIHQHLLGRFDIASSHWVPQFKLLPIRFLCPALTELLNDLLTLRLLNEGLKHCLDLILSRLDHFLDQLTLHVHELDAKPDVSDVVLASDHQVKRVDLVLLDHFVTAGPTCRLQIILVKQFDCQCDCLLTESIAIDFLLADLICTCHGPLRDLPLDHKLDIHLVVDL